MTHHISNWTRRYSFLCALIVVAACGASTRNGERPLVRVNDNRAAAGRMRGDTLDLRLIVRAAAWRPESDSGPTIEVDAFAEEGQVPQIPAPLIRVPLGTTIAATIKNALRDSTIRIVGFSTSEADSIVIRPGDSAAVRFTPRQAGTSLYAAVLGTHDHDKDDEREQLAGALIVDPLEGSPPDRVLVMNIWSRQIDSATYQNTLTINGKTWPFDERIDATVGDTLRWRVINATHRPHPMHLHGFFFDVLSRGRFGRDSTFAASDRPRVVTDVMPSFATMTMEWTPEREGQWLFHCHIGFHVIPDNRLVPPPKHAAGAHDPATHMAGLLLGINVKARPGVTLAGGPVTPARPMRLFVQESPRRGRAPRSLGFVLQRGDVPPASDSVEIPGAPLILTRGQRTDVTVINRLREPTAVHWHGIELESYSDGVPGWSGTGNRLAPSIAPKDSFVAHLTLPRAGTFMYHTHLNDFEQLTSGLYGAIVVLEPGEVFDPRHDHVFVAGWDGAEDPPHLLVNGDSLPRPLAIDAQSTHRLRFVNIGMAVPYRITLLKGDSAVAWTPVAKDGAALTTRQRRSAEILLDVGETFDAETRLAPGNYRLVFFLGKTTKIAREQRVIVR